MSAYKSIETRQTWVSDVILCLWSLWWPIDPTSTFCFKEFVWKRVELQRANSFHYLARLWSKHGASRIRRDSCWKAELPRIGNGWWPKWNRNRAYQKCCIEGEWVCLKNLHLVTSWLPSLEKEIKMLNPDKKFRLWLTSEPHGKFPSILLQSSLKITYETPPGLKSNLMRTFSYVTPSQEQQQQNPVMTQLLFVLSWFHALI